MPQRAARSSAAELRVRHDSPPRRGACRGARPLTAHPAPSPSLRRRPTHLVIVQARLQDLVELAGQRVGAGGSREPRRGGGGRWRRRGGVGHGCGPARPQRRTRSGSGGNALRALGSGLTRAGCGARPRLVRGSTRVFLFISKFVFTDKIKGYKNKIISS